MPGAEVRYTTDGSDPASSGQIYSGPFILTATSTIKAIAFSDGKPFSKVSEKKVWLHLATGRKITYLQPWSEKYSGSGATTLVNSIRGSVNYSDGCWLGFHGNDAECTIDLGSPVEVSKVAVGALQSVGAWIFFPVSVEVLTAGDDGTFTTAGIAQNSISTSDPERKIQDFTVSFSPVKTRLVKVIAKNLGTCPAGHAGAGDKAWMFLDEIVVE
jgi:hexosaminidase